MNTTELEKVLREVVTQASNDPLKSVAKRPLRGTGSKVAQYSDIVVTSLYLVAISQLDLAKSILEAFVDGEDYDSDREDLWHEVANGYLLLSLISCRTNEKTKEQQYVKTVFEYSLGGEPDPDLVDGYFYDLPYTQMDIEYAESQPTKEKAAILAGEVLRYLFYWKMTRYHDDLVTPDLTTEIRTRTMEFLEHLERTLSAN